MALRDTAETLELAERSGDDLALSLARTARGIALIYGHSPESDAGGALLATVREDILHERFSHPVLPFIDFELARAKARSGDFEGAIEISQRYVLDELSEGGLGFIGPAVSVLVESLLLRGTDGDVNDAKIAVSRLATAAADNPFVTFDVMLLRLRALLARAQDDDAAYRDLVERYRAMAESLGFDGHVAMAEEMQKTAGHGI